MISKKLTVVIERQKSVNITQLDKQQSHYGKSPAKVIKRRRKIMETPPNACRMTYGGMENCISFLT
jgi:hypothetical protein